MNEQQIAQRIKQYLNLGLSLDAVTLAKLKAARERALERHHVAEPYPVLAWAGQVTGIAGGSRSAVSRLLLPALVLALGLFVVAYWYQAQVSQENVEIDAAVLMGELPIDAYLDKGFDAWLKRSSE